MLFERGAEVIGRAAIGFAGIALALGLTQVAIHLLGINVIGLSVDPARSIARALFAGGVALWLCWFTRRGFLPPDRR